MQAITLSNSMMTSLKHLRGLIFLDRKYLVFPENAIKPAYNDTGTRRTLLFFLSPFFLESLPMLSFIILELSDFEMEYTR